MIMLYLNFFSILLIKSNLLLFSIIDAILIRGYAPMIKHHIYNLFAYEKKKMEDLNS
jgi:hypothetical protein